ncbi:GTPase IMAP family member 2-like [Chanodichthys erythropterus]|uniref:GTPase IMAP family member 2-like n=1 Tax=Chanodichthys erythropterus TaxID=933992 RepID=UPI00351F46F9
MASLQGSSVQSDLRIVIIGNAGDEKNKVVKSVLNCENPTGEKVGLCTLHQCEHEGRRISVVEAPGWDKVSTQQSAENMKEEVERSVSLCPPGPHALLLVIPVRISEEPSPNDITAAQMHMELLSERVWKHTILLFACEEGVRDFNIQSYFQKAKKILDKCKGKACVLESHSKISELFTKIEDLMEENCGDVFLPQVYYELIQRKTGSLRFRRGSLQKNPPNMTKNKPHLALLFILIIWVTMMAIASFIAVPRSELGLHRDLVWGVCTAVILFVLAVFLAVYLHSKENRMKKKRHKTKSRLKT